MANLKVTVVVRTSSPEGERSWVVANGKTDPPSGYYLRHWQGSSLKYIKAGNFYDEAELAQMRLERRLKAQSLGLTALEEIPNKTFHRIPEVISPCLADLRLNRRPEKSVKSRKSKLEPFAKFRGRVYVEEIARTDLIQYRNHLLDAGKAQVTAPNKFMSIMTWLKKNTVVGIVGLLKTEDWPKKPDTEPHPYTGGCMLRSKTGWAFATSYLIAAFFFLWDGLTCVGMLCDLPAFLALLPAGEAYYAVSNFFLGYAPDPLIGFYPPLSARADPIRFIKWGFIIPSVLTNVILFYCLGRVIERVTIRFWVRRRSSE